MLAAALVACLAFHPTVAVGRPKPLLQRAEPRAPRAAAPRASAISVPALAVATAVPSLLGLAKREWTVSYGYGGAMALAGALALRAASPISPVGPVHVHAVLYILYGVRLCAYLLWRELSIEKFRAMRERIEQRAPPGSRVKRIPFCLSCAVLYFFMAAPLVLTATLPVKWCSAGPLSQAAAGALGLGYLGWAVAALGDTQKAMAKAAMGGDGLVTSGLFSVLRHPNYSGEALLWLSSTAAGMLCAALAPTKTVLAWVAASVAGCAGIQFVLAGATLGLEKRHREKYGSLPEYQQWKAWPGIMLRPPPASSSGDASADGNSDGAAGAAPAQ